MVDKINDEFSEFQDYLVTRSKRLKLPVSFDFDDYDRLQSLLSEIRYKEVKV